MDAANNIILVGFSGTGKTLVGQDVARTLGWEFVDMDSQIEHRAGKSVRRIFTEDGEQAFRLLEKKVLHEVCSGRSRVVSTGGGVVVDPGNRELMLTRGFVVCLDAQPETIYGRLVGNDANPVEERPLLSGPDPLERIESLKAARQACYSEAHRMVPTDDLTVEETALEVVRAWRLFDPSAACTDSRGPGRRPAAPGGRPPGQWRI